LGDWKLIRFFADNDDGSDRFELYNLKDDLGESKNLADANPERVGELDELITGFLRDTEAVIPVRNPGYDPNPPPKKPKAKAKAESGASL
jgi:arylsulfatase A-like enzyme